MEFVEKKRLLFFGLPWTFTRYTIGEECITIRAGFFKIIEDDCYMYKVQDVKLECTLLERIFKLSTVVCYTGDTTHQKLCLTHIRNGRAIKDFIFEQSEKARMKRRTINTLDIGSGDVDLDD
ncbi:MAG: PH domain-containing protein [Lachnospiraceae bacterium]|nr:PH domain-containing protein [Lachnospiraceae bacterium]